MSNIQIEIKEDTSYKELAKEIANIIKEDYGSHNIKPFIEELNKNLIGDKNETN